MPQADEWCCTKCSKLLGILHHRRIVLRFAGGHQYIVAPPASTICKRCGALNEIPADFVSRRSPG